MSSNSIYKQSQTAFKSRYARRIIPFFICTLIAVLLLFIIPNCAHAADMPIPSVQLGMGTAHNRSQVAVTMQILMLMTVLTLAPSIFILTTAFTRIVIVFSILRSALGSPQIPPNQVMIGLALFLTYFVMQPTVNAINKNAVQPYMKHQIDLPTALDQAELPLHSFMMRQTYKSDLAFFINASHAQRPKSAADVNMVTLIPAFITSELKTAFIIGFYIYLPFLVIDLVVASTLMSMGMMMLPPTVVSLPAKILLFVMANGWTLVIGSLIHSFR